VQQGQSKIANYQKCIEKQKVQKHKLTTISLTVDFYFVGSLLFVCECVYTNIVSTIWHVVYFYSFLRAFE